MHKDIPWIHLLRGIACLMVVCLHCQTAANFYPLDEGTRHFDSVVSLVTKPCVPLFFMITGYLILPYKYGNDIMSFYKKRIPRVFFPLIVWGIIYATLPYFLGMCSAKKMVSEILLSPIKAPQIVGGILWYLFILIGIYLTIPFITERIYVSKRILQLWLSVWILTSVVYIVKLFVPDILGQNKWVQNFDLTIYFSGYLGYVLMGYYLHNFQVPLLPELKALGGGKTIYAILATLLLAVNWKFELGSSFLAVGTVALSIDTFRRSLILPCLEHGSASQNIVHRRYIFSISFVPLHHEAERSSKQV